MKKKELIDLVNNSCLYSICDAEDVIPKEVKCVATDVERYRYRWYSTCVNVYACEDGYVGIWGVSQLYSDMMTFSDCQCEALEYEEVTTITYKPKRLQYDRKYNIYSRYFIRFICLFNVLLGKQSW